MYDGIFVNPLFDYSYGHSLEDEPGFAEIQHSPNNPNPAHTHVKYAGSGFESLSQVGDQPGPTPLISISKNFIQNEIGIITAVEDTVTLEGYIMATGTAAGKGPVGLLNAVSGMEKHLTDYPQGRFEITCNTTKLYELNGARPTELTFNQNTNGWTQYIVYNATFVGTQSGTGNLKYPVRNTVDSWNIEPVEETSLYEKMIMPAKIKGANGQPQDKNVIEYNFPRFKVTHRVAANGLPSTGNNTTNTNINKVYWQALENAQMWVSGRLSYNNTHTNASGVGWGDGAVANNANRKFNFTRSVNYDLSTALYEVLDTWVSMPSGSLFHEDYTIEVSTNEKYIKTIRVNGTIQGLGGWNDTLVTKEGTITGGTVDMRELGGYKSSGQGTAWAPTTGNSTSWSAVTMSGTKFDNALIAWHGDTGASAANPGGIKNLLFWRASSALNASSKYGSYTAQFNPSSYNRFTSVNNPINSKESLLWPIPISTSETFDPKNGSVSYSYEFNNKLQAITGAISENVVINDTGPTDVFAEVFVLGRRLGPVLQGLGAKTSSKRDVSIELTVMPPTGFNGYFMTQEACPLYTGGSIYNLVDKMASGLMPFGPRDGSVFVGGTRAQVQQGKVFVTRDDQSWNPAEGTYSRTLSWVYQQCNTGRRWDDI